MTNYLLPDENMDSDPSESALTKRETSEQIILQAINTDIQ